MDYAQHRFVPIPSEALELEQRSIGPHGERTIFAAYEIERDALAKDQADRELGLHLLFLSWYLLSEPPYLTGLDESRLQPGELADTFNRVHSQMQPKIRRDAEMLWVVALMAELSPYLLGNEAEWEERSRDYHAESRRICPSGIDPAVFAGRGAYGNYFGHHARVSQGG